jgi:hypothetical protein
MMTTMARDGDDEPEPPEDPGSPGWFAYVPLSQVGLPPGYDAAAARHDAELKGREQARSRNEDGTPRKYRLMSDYSAEPIWSTHGMVPVSWLGLSPELESDIVAWDDLFQSNFHWEDEWRDDEARLEYARLGPVLRDRLAKEIGAFGVVELNMWPVRRTSGD